MHSGPSRKHGNQINYFRIGIEEAGGLLGLSKNIQKNIQKIFDFFSRWCILEIVREPNQTTNP